MLYVGSDRYKVYVGDDRLKVIPTSKHSYDSEIAYLESTGTQYIDIGLSCNANYTIEVEFNTALNTEAIFGVRTSAGNKEHSLVMTSDGYVGFRSRATSTVSEARYTGYTASTWTNIKCSCDEIYVDGVFVARAAKWVAFTDTKHYYLFGMNTNGTASNLGPKKIRRFKVKDTSGTLLLDMIPVRIAQVGYMYDRVSNQFFGNDGTGAFNIGSDVN